MQRRSAARLAASTWPPPDRPPSVDVVVPCFNEDPDLTQAYRGQPCVSGDDLHLTNLVLAADQAHKATYVPTARAWTQVPETLGGFARQQTRWNRSFYRELRWTRAALRGRSGYLYLDTTARLLAPLLLTAVLVLTAADTVARHGDPGRNLAGVVAVLVSGALATIGRRPRLGPLHATGLLEDADGAQMAALVLVRHAKSQPDVGLPPSGRQARRTSSGSA